MASSGKHFPQTQLFFRWHVLYRKVMLIIINFDWITFAKHYRPKMIYVTTRYNDGHLSIWLTQWRTTGTPEVPASPAASTSMRMTSLWTIRQQIWHFQAHYMVLWEPLYFQDFFQQCLGAKELNKALLKPMAAKFSCYLLSNWWVFLGELIFIIPRYSRGLDTVLPSQ